MIQKYFKTTLCGAEKKSTYPQIIRQNEAKMPLPPPPQKKKNHRMTDRLICKMVGTLTDQ